MVEGDGLENRSAKAPGVRIPPPPPSKKQIGAAQRRLEALLERHGLLLVHDAKLPSATACIAGAPVPGSWWGHPQGKLIYETLERLGESVAWVKLVTGKETLLHRRLWPALVAVAESGQAWQTRGLTADARRLLAHLRRGGAVRTDEARPATGRKLSAGATELERRLLAHARSEHTASGHHARFLETWGAWGRARGLDARELPGPDDAMAALAAPVLAWTGGRAPAGLLPWTGG